VIRAELNLVGLAMRAKRKVIDKIVDGLKFHSYRVFERSGYRFARRKRVARLVHRFGARRPYEVALQM
jgi:hypothetical protein